MLLAVLGAGEIFGELALLTESPRSATAVSFGGAKVKPVDMDMFGSMLPESPDLIRKIITSISHRLWFNHVRLSQMSYRKPVTRLFAFLETKLMEDGVSLGRKAPHQLQFGLDELIEMNELSAENHLQMWIPEGFAHGFYVLSDFAEFIYKTTDYWAPQYERTLIWNDPDLAIAWPIAEKPILSAKDAMGVSFRTAECFG